MKKLYLIRHAKSSWKNPALRDIDRPLNKRGKHDAPLMGKRLSSYDVLPDAIISSPARRALKTARIIAEELGIARKTIDIRKELYPGEADRLLEMIRSFRDDDDDVVIVGHNPGFTELANLLADSNIDNIPTCGIFCVEFHTDTWKSVGKGAGALVFFDYPKKKRMIA